MCAIAGIIGINHASTYMERMLYRLQHRGQESAGMATGSPAREEIRWHRGLGLVKQVFNTAKLADLGGTIAVGHTRYSTAGGNSIENAQPFVVETRWGSFGLVTNGNLTNPTNLRNRVQQANAVLTGTTDSEIIAHLIAQSPANTFEAAIKDAMQQMHGAYQVLINTSDKLYAFSDPFGYRPLSIGRITIGEESGHVFASETCAFDVIGATHIGQVLPGQLITISSKSSDQQRVMKLVDQKGPKNCIFEWMYLGSAGSEVFGSSVYEARRRFGQLLANHAPAPLRADTETVVVAVPESGRDSAESYAYTLGLQLVNGLRRNPYYLGRTFIQPNDSMRRNGIDEKFDVVKAAVEGKIVVMVDDSIVRGNTTRILIRKMREAGALEVHVRITSPPVKWPCFYGVDTPDQSLLIAAKNDVESVRDLIDADSLSYLGLENAALAIQRPSAHFCDACFTGNYPERPEGSLIQIDLGQPKTTVHEAAAV